MGCQPLYTLLCFKLAKTLNGSVSSGSDSLVLGNENSTLTEFGHGITFYVYFSIILSGYRAAAASSLMRASQVNSTNFATEATQAENLQFECVSRP